MYYIIFRKFLIQQPLNSHLALGFHVGDNGGFKQAFVNVHHSVEQEYFDASFLCTSRTRSNRRLLADIRVIHTIGDELLSCVQPLVILKAEG